MSPQPSRRHLTPGSQSVTPDPRSAPEAPIDTTGNAVASGTTATDPTASGTTATALFEEVARAVGLQEGAAGVEAVLRAFRQVEVTSTRAISRFIGLPLPIVAAVNNELRNRGVLTRDRPSRLTAQGAALLADAPADAAIDPACDCCHGYGVVIPPALADLTGELDELIRQAPAADLTLDQSHCTAETKLRRVLLLLRYGLLPTAGLLVVGDDDLMGITMAMVGARLGQPLVRRLGIVDVDTDLLDFIEERLGDLDTRAELVEQDLREPLDRRLVGGFELAMTDPPYTVEGAELFLSRAVAGLRPGPGRAVAFSFGPKGPDETLAVQEAITGLGLAVQASHRGFNEYHGAGVIGGRSNLQYLTTTGRTAGGTGDRYAGPLYTADKRGADRLYRCVDCGARRPVGPGAQWTTIGALKQAGCPDCGGHRFAPQQLVRSDRPR